MPVAPYLLIFFVSGACSLAYEVVWTRLLGLSIGHTTVALTAVVAAYMGGLAAGSAWCGRYLRRGMPPALLYAALEAGIALLALAFPLQLSVVGGLSSGAGQWLDRGSTSLGIVRFGLATLAVVPATFLMGGTLPAMLEAIPARSAHAAARSAGLLYAVNTAGAVVGAALAGFVLIERLGTLETTWMAAAGNLLVAVAAVALYRGSGERRPPPLATQVTGVRGPGRHAILLAYALSGFTALTCQIVWTRALVFFAGSTTYAFTSMLVVFLAGVTLGSAMATPFVERLRRPARAFVVVQVALALASGASLRLLQVATPWIDGRWNPELSWAALLTGGFLKAATTMAAPTLLMGTLFPLAARLAGVSAEGAAGHGGRATLIGRLYALNTLGGIVGAALSGLVLLPLLGIRGTLLLACLVAIAASALVWSAHGRRRGELAGLLAGAAACVLLAGPGSPLHSPSGSEQLLFYEEGPSGTISVLQEVTGTRTIYIDRVPVAGTDTIMLTDQKSLAHVPMLLNPGAKRALTVGFGSGGASWSFTRHSVLERVDAVEIDPSVFRAAPHLEASNHQVWRDPRFRLILEDARNYLASTQERYDIISTDCTDLRYKTNANLYTVDYFSLVRDRLEPGGVVTVWMPLGGLGGDTFRMAVRTFREVFPHTTIWYMTNQPTHYLLLVGADHAVRPDIRAIEGRLQEASVRDDLREIRLDDPFKLASSLLLDEDEVARLVGIGPLNTDRRPLLEFQAPRLAYRDALATNLRAVASAREPRPLPRSTPPGVSTADRLARYEAATPALVEGHARYQLGTFDYAGALRLYRAAATINPDDRSIPPLIADVEHTRDVWLGEFRARTGGRSADVRDWLAYATLLRQQGRLDDAVAAARRATEIAPTSTEAWLRLAATYSQAGATADALAALDRARQHDPNDPMVLSDLGAALNDAGRYAEAESVLVASLGARPTADAHNNRGVALNGLERPADAVAAFGAALSLNPSSAEAWFNLGVAHAMLGQLADARTAYQHGLALMPAEPRALANLAMVEAQAARLDLTVAYLREAVAASPNRSPAMLNDLGRAYLGLREIDAAIAALEEAARLDPGSSAIAENLALARAARNRPTVR